MTRFSPFKNNGPILCVLELITHPDCVMSEHLNMFQRYNAVAENSVENNFASKP